MEHDRRASLPTRVLHPRAARLVFRSWREEDVDVAMELWGDPRVTAFVDARGALDREAVRARLAVEIDLEARFGVQYWPAFLASAPASGTASASAPGELAGAAGLRPRASRDGARDDAGTFELGFHLCARAWGRGLATEAARAVAELAFDRLEARSLFAGHHPKNEASARVLAKLGFRRTHDELYPPTGLMHPSYTLARADFRRA